MYRNGLNSASRYHQGTIGVLKKKEGDHRTRVARERRERMATRLLDAVFACYAEHVQAGPPTVDELIGRAEVSRATFYKYFVSVEDAVEERGKLLVFEMVHNLHGMADPKFSALYLLTMSVYLFLLRGVLDRTWAAFISRGDLLKARGELFDGLTLHLSEAKVAEAIRFRDLDAARSLVVGPMQEVLKTIVREGKHDRCYLEEVMEMILASLGADRATAAEAVRDVTIYIRGAAPDRLEWWRDPWRDSNSSSSAAS